MVSGAFKMPTVVQYAEGKRSSHQLVHVQVPLGPIGAGATYLLWLGGVLFGGVRVSRFTCARASARVYLSLGWHGLIEMAAPQGGKSQDNWAAQRRRQGWTGRAGVVGT